MNRLGPLAFATLQCADAVATAAAYERHFGFQIQREERLSADWAAACAMPDWQGASCLWLSSLSTTPWLRIVQPRSRPPPPTPLKQQGWMALEVAVENVDALAEELNQGLFSVIGAPANLAVSDAIRAMQVVGPAGEVLYLTEVRSEVPPFELPQAEAFVDRLFIAVLACNDLAASQAFYHQLGADQPLQFSTRIGVLNRAWKQPPEHEYQVATAQLAGRTLFEIDHLPEADSLPASALIPPSGIASVGLIADNLKALACQWRAPPRPIADFPWQGQLGGCALGPTGEWLEFMQRP